MEKTEMGKPQKKKNDRFTRAGKISQIIHLYCGGKVGSDKCGKMNIVEVETSITRM